jgi:DNA-binding GntR family transcriptional regulator
VTTPASSPTTAQEHALESLRRLIIDGRLRPGERVNQEDVAAEFGLSVAPVREALRVLEQEGQLTYRPRRGYFVTELNIADLEEIYALREILEERAARLALPSMDREGVARITRAARDCVDAAEAADVGAELEANRRFHLAILDAPGQPHTSRMIRLLWDSTEAYRAIYYNSPEERLASIEAHDRIVAAIHKGDIEGLLGELNAHRHRALDVLRTVLSADVRDAEPRP